MFTFTASATPHSSRGCKTSLLRQQLLASREEAEELREEAEELREENAHLKEQLVAIKDMYDDC